MSKGKFETRIFAEAIVFVAVSAVLNSVKLFQMPYGGSVTLGGMVPVLWLSLRRGVVLGTYAGMVLGLVVLVIEPFFAPGIPPVQVLLDYPVAFGALGLAGLFQKRPLVGVGVGLLGRFIAHFLSGIFFWWMYAPPELDPVAYSAVYNGFYMIPEFIVSAVLIYLLDKRNVLRVYM